MIQRASLLTYWVLIRKRTDVINRVHRPRCPHWADLQWETDQVAIHTTNLTSLPTDYSLTLPSKMSTSKTFTIITCSVLLIDQRTVEIYLQAHCRPPTTRRLTESRQTSLSKTNWAAHLSDQSLLTVKLALILAKDSTWECHPEISTIRLELQSAKSERALPDHCTAKVDHQGLKEVALLTLNSM